MERGYNEYTMAFINQGEERARMDCGMNLVRDGVCTVRVAAKSCKVDETKLVNYIKTCNGNNPN